MYRLKKRHSRHIDAPAREADAAHLFREQSLSRAATAAVVALAAMVALDVAVSMLFDRYFPWFCVPQAFVIGTAMRRYGRGIDWQFPALAAAFAAAGTLLGSFLVALFLTGREFRTGALALVDEISWHTIDAFLEKDFGTVEIIYMGMATAVAAFYAIRRLSRQENIALRRLRESGTATRR